MILSRKTSRDFISPKKTNRGYRYFLSTRKGNSSALEKLKRGFRLFLLIVKMKSFFSILLVRNKKPRCKR